MPEELKSKNLTSTDSLSKKDVVEEIDLNSNVTDSEKDTQTTKKRSLVGSMKGTFVLPLPDDFNEPLEEFEEYM